MYVGEQYEEPTSISLGITVSDKNYYIFCKIYKYN